MNTVDAYIREIALGNLAAPRGFWDWIYSGMPVPQPFDEHWIEQCAAVRMGWSLATGTVVAEFPLLPAPSEKTLQYWRMIRSRTEHLRQCGLPTGAQLDGGCVSSVAILGRQIVMGRSYQANSKYQPDAIHVVVSEDHEHLIVCTGEDCHRRFDRMLERLKGCANRQAAKAVTTPKVIYADGSTVQPEIAVDQGSEFDVDQAVEYHTWEGRNENYRQVWKPATVKVIGPKKILIQFNQKTIWVQKRSIRPVVPEGINQWPELVQLALF